MPLKLYIPDEIGVTDSEANGNVPHNVFPALAKVLNAVYKVKIVVYKCKGKI
jgi:hypothetical protein